MPEMRQFERDRRRLGKHLSAIWRWPENVFADLGLPVEEAENLRVRADLMIATQQEAARQFSVSQP